MASQAALSVYVEHVIGARIQQLKLENDSLEALRNLIQRVRVLRLDGPDYLYAGAECVAVLNLLEGDHDHDEDYISLFCNTSLEIPHKEIKFLQLEISGFPQKSTVFISFCEPDDEDPQLPPNGDETVLMKVHFPEIATTITGSLQNFAGTAKEVLGLHARNVETGDMGRARLALGRALDGGTFLMRKIEIGKDIVKKTLSALNGELPAGRKVDEDGLWELEAWKNLSEASTKQDNRLFAIVDERLALERHSTILQSLQSLVETIEVRYQYGGSWSTLRFNLEDGHSGVNVGNDPAWILPVKGVGGNPLASIMSMQCLLGGVPHQSPTRGFSLSRDSPHNVGVEIHPFVWAVFSFNESLGDSRELMNFLLRNLPRISLGGGPSVALQLVRLEIKHDAIVGLLDTLRLDKQA